MDIWIKVAEFVKPNPVTFARLALVSREFYLIFTSDRVWKHINPYGLNANIHMHFITKLTQDQQNRVGALWQSYRYYDQRRPYDSELYGVLGILVKLRSTHYPFIVIDNPQLMWCAINLNENAIRFASNTIKEDRRFARLVISKRGCLIDRLGRSIRDDRELALLAVKQGCPKRCSSHMKTGFPLQEFSPRLRNDCEIIINAVQKDGLLIKYASRVLRSSETIVELAIRQTPRAILYSYLLSNRRLVSKAIKSWPAILELTIDFYDDDETVLAAVSRRGRVLQFASKRLRNNLKVGLNAVLNEPLALQFCSSFLRQSPEVVKAAVSENGLALKWSPYFWGDKKMLEIATNQSYHSLRYASGVLTDNYDFMLRQVAKDGRAIQYCSPRLINNYTIVFTAVKNNGKALAYVDEPFTSSRSLVLCAIKTYPEAALWAHPKIKQERAVASALEKVGRRDIMRNMMDPQCKRELHEDWPLKQLDFSII